MAPIKELREVDCASITSYIEVLNKSQTSSQKSTKQNKTHKNGEPVASVLYYFLMSLANVVSPSPLLAKIKHSSLTRWRMEMQKARELL